MCVATARLARRVRRRTRRSCFALASRRRVSASPASPAHSIPTFASPLRPVPLTATATNVSGRGDPNRPATSKTATAASGSTSSYSQACRISTGPPPSTTRSSPTGRPMSASKPGSRGARCAFGAPSPKSASLRPSAGAMSGASAAISTAPAGRCRKHRLRRSPGPRRIEERGAVDGPRHVERERVGNRRQNVDRLGVHVAHALRHRGCLPET